MILSVHHHILPILSHVVEVIFKDFMEEISDPGHIHYLLFPLIDIHFRQEILLCPAIFAE